MISGRWLLAVLFIVAGSMHFVLTPYYLKIMPPYLPAPEFLVEFSGICEILGGIGLLLSPTRTLAAWGLIALLIAVLPANVYMALDHSHWPQIPVWALWARLPLQLPIIWWAWLYARSR